MRTVYAVRVSVPEPSPALWDEMRSLLVSWLERTYPFDERAAGTQVRLVDESDWIRLVVDQHVDSSTTSQIAVTLTVRPVAGRAGDRRAGTMQFEARQSVVPREVRVTQRSSPQASPPLLRVVRAVVERIGARDAGVPVSATATVVGSELGAQGVAALCDAPSRTLPVVVETVSVGGRRTIGVDKGAPALAGLAHVVVLSDDGVRRAFNEAWGSDVLAPASLAVFWPDKVPVTRVSGEGLTEQGAHRVIVDVIHTVIDAAALSLPDLPRPRRPEASTPDTTRTPPSDSAPHVEPSDVEPPGEAVPLTELLGALDELSQAWDRVDDLQSALARADAMLAASQARTDLLTSQIDELVSAKVRLEIQQGRRPDTLSARNAADAVAQARQICTHLHFVGDDRYLAELDGIDATALLVDLARLDSVALQWLTGDITDTTFALACRNVGLDYAPDVSDTARQEFPEDYTVMWQGRPVLAVAHVRRGRGVHLYRIHLFLDRERRQVVVGHIGRHLRGKRS